MGANAEPRISLPRIGLGLLLFMFAVIPVFAQPGASTGLRGRVIDTSGAAMPGVTVTVTAVETASQRTVITGPTGEWEARFLSPGAYRIKFELTGFSHALGLKFRF